MVLALFSLASATQLRSQESTPRRLNFLCDTLGLFCPETSTSSTKCQAVSPLSAAEFDLEEYIRLSWFIQKQQVNPYQSENQLFCTAATYSMSKKNDGFLEVDNYSNNDMVNGPVQSSDDNSAFSNLCGKQVDGGKLSVAPCAFKDLWDTVAGPYWVLAVGDDYEWAIVSGGQPNQPYPSASNPTLCTTKEGSSFLDTNGSGLWLFTREQERDATTIETMENALLAMGVYTGNLKDVTQEGCGYAGTNLKLDLDKL
jgi:lipocalin